MPARRDRERPVGVARQHLGRSLRVVEEEQSVIDGDRQQRGRARQVARILEEAGVREGLWCATTPDSAHAQATATIRVRRRGIDLGEEERTIGAEIEDELAGTPQAIDPGDQRSGRSDDGLRIGALVEPAPQRPEARAGVASHDRTGEREDQPGRGGSTKGSGEEQPGARDGHGDRIVNRFSNLRGPRGDLRPRTIGG